MPSDASLKKEGRGATVLQTAIVDGVELRAIKWFDNRGVVLLSTFAAVEPTKQIKRWDSKNKQYVEVKCPSAVTVYNQFMGGVDLLDSLLALYRIPVRSKKWYHRLLWHFLDLAVVQSWIIYKRDLEASCIPAAERLSLLQFKLNIAESLVKAGKPVGPGVKRGRRSLDVDVAYEVKKARGPAAPIPITAVRTDNTAHWPSFSEKKGRCKYPECKGTPKVKCIKCEVYLCFTPQSNCFKSFHQ